MPTPDQIKGCLYGIAIGDALGAPAEAMSFAKVIEKYGRITEYIAPKGHKYLPDGRPPGMPTDDWQLSLATARAILEADGFDIDVMVKHHIIALNESTAGWGKTTKEAVKRLKKGVLPEEAAISAADRGTGNGVCMKVAPLGLWAACAKADYRDFIAPYARLTHNSRMAVASGAVMIAAIQYCLETTPPKFDSMALKDEVMRACQWAEGQTNIPELGAGKYVVLDGSPDTNPKFHKLSDPLSFLDMAHRYTPERLIECFRGGCYVYESLPFTLMFFANTPTIDTLYDLASAGGDTDSNAAMAGALLGCLYGLSVFPDNLINGLSNKDEVEKVAEDFATKYG